MASLDKTKTKEVLFVKQITVNPYKGATDASKCVHFYCNLAL
jgi:hypothetical protein